MYFSNDMFTGTIFSLIGIGVAIGLAIAGIIWGVVVLFPHISILWK